MAPEQECLQYHTASVRDRILERIGQKQARKSSEDAQATEYAQFKKVWAG